MAIQELTAEERRLYRIMLESEAWRIARGRLEQLSIKKEREKAESLRVHDFDGANRLQGIVDGLVYAIDTIEKVNMNDPQDENLEGPIY